MIKRLKISVHQKNLSAYVDIFINHGSNLAFPWLIAHHLSYFKGFGNLQLLDTLLTHRRGFNAGLGSKVRKLYFSDVKRILLEKSEFRLSFCEDFNQTKHYHDTSSVKDCLNCIHDVCEVERFEILNDVFDEHFDRAEPDLKKRRVPTLKIEQLKPENEKYVKFWENLMKKSDEIRRKFMDEEVISKMKIKKAEREKAVGEIDAKLTKLRCEMKQIPETYNLIYIEDSVIPKKGHVLEKLLTIMSEMINTMTNNDYVLEPIRELIDMPKLYTKDRPILDKNVSEYFRRKKEKSFMTIEEIDHRCRQMHLKDKVDDYNKSNDEMEKLREYCINLRNSGERVPNSLKTKFKEMAEAVEASRLQCVPMIELYTEISKTYNDEETFKKPKNLRPVLKNLGNKDGEMDILWGAFTLNTEKELFLANLKGLKDRLEKEVEGKWGLEMMLGLENEIKKKYEEERDYVLKCLNESKEIDISKMNQSYEKIVEKRAKLISEKQGSIFRFEDLKLNPMEDEKIRHSCEYLRSEERNYNLYKIYVRDKTTSFTVCKENRIKFQERFGVDSKLSDDDWQKQLFLIHEEEYRSLLTEFEKQLNIFKEICGVSPYGIIIGSIYEKRRVEDFEKDFDNFFYARNWQESLRVEATKITSTICKEHDDVKDYPFDFLRALTKNFTVINNERFCKSEKERLNSQIRILNEEKEKVLKIDGLEMIYEAYSSSEGEKSIREPSKMKIPLKNRNKVERDFSCKKLKRAAAEKMYEKIVTELAITSKNMYEELEVEEAIVDARNSINNIFESEVAPYYCYDYNKYKNFRRLKMEEKKKIDADCNDVKEKIRKYNEFDILHNSNANKKYDVCGAISYLKILMACKLLRLNTNKNIYNIFGLKKCQSNYLNENIRKISERLFKTMSNKSAI